MQCNWHGWQACDNNSNGKGTTFLFFTRAPLQEAHLQFFALGKNANRWYTCQCTRDRLKEKKPLRTAYIDDVETVGTFTANFRFRVMRQLVLMFYYSSKVLVKVGGLPVG